MTPAAQSPARRRALSHPAPIRSWHADTEAAAAAIKARIAAELAMPTPTPKVEEAGE